MPSHPKDFTPSCARARPRRCARGGAAAPGYTCLSGQRSPSGHQSRTRLISGHEPCLGKLVSRGSVGVRVPPRLHLRLTFNQGVPGSSPGRPTNLRDISGPRSAGLLSPGCGARGRWGSRKSCGQRRSPNSKMIVTYSSPYNVVGHAAEHRSVGKLPRQPRQRFNVVRRSSSPR